MANDPPPTTIAGKVSRTPRHPSIIAIIQTNTIGTIKGNWRPTIWLMAWVSTPDTCPATMIGIPIAPKATGAVLTIRQSPAAYKGLNPNPTNNAAVIATGAPKPAAPSKKVPKANPTSNICKRWSSVSDKILERIISNCPVFTVTLYKNTAPIIIQAIGQSP